jgi:CubicO group peptidase (beta-lactamase class C family)
MRSAGGMSGERARQLLEDARRAGVFPGAVAEVGSSGGTLWRTAVGTLSFQDATPVDEHTWFDLASLTKPIATATVVIALAAGRRVRLDDRLHDIFDEWRGSDRYSVTVRDLLEHASGLPARLLDRPPATRREFAHDICTMPLEYAPRSRALYSDLGFILLGFAAEQIAGRPLDVQLFEIWPRPPWFPSRARPGRTAPTMPLPGDPRRGRLLVGEVHDDYAAALGGVAGHAGLFGTAGSVGEFARTFLTGRVPGPGGGPLPSDWMGALTRRSTVPGSSRALGWDTMLPTSSCGTRMSAAAFGHVGFTGTSLWIDPSRDRYFVLLTNRACGGGSIEQMRSVRRAFHDALADA